MYVIFFISFFALGSVQKADLLSRFILLSESPEQNFTDKTLRDIILNFIIAGEHYAFWSFVEQYYAVFQRGLRSSSYS